MLTENVRRAAAEFGARPAFVTADGWAVSYAELDRTADEVASALRTMGVGDGATVALVLESTVDYVALYLGLARIGATTAGINPRLGRRETNACLAALGPDLVVARSASASPQAPPASHAAPGTPTDSSAPSPVSTRAGPGAVAAMAWRRPSSPTSAS